MKIYIKRRDYKNVFSFPLLCLLLLLTSLSFISCPNMAQLDGEVAVSDVSLNYTSITMTSTPAASIGGEVQLVATIEPEHASNKKVTWSSTDSAIATVSQTGLVEMLGPGSVWIYARTDDGEHSSGCYISIPPPFPVLPESVTLETDSILMLTGETRGLAYEILPADANQLDVTWQSGNSSVISFNESNELVAEGAGFTTVTVKTVNNKQDHCSVRVIDEIVDVTGISLPDTLVVPTNGGDSNKFLLASLTPADATFQSVQWSGYDQELITVTPSTMDEKGCTISPNSGEAGTTTITVASDDGGFTAESVVEVIIPAESISYINIDEEKFSITVQPNSTYQVEIVTIPENITTDLDWTIQGQGMTIDQNGLITVGPSPTLCHVDVRDGYYFGIGPPGMLNVLVEE